MQASRVILHLDVNACYAQIERVRLGLTEDIPLAVSQWGGLIAVGYAARPFGISRHDTATEAKKKCPHIVLPHVELVDEYGKVVDNPGAADKDRCKVSLGRYRKASKKLFDEFIEIVGADHVEKASIDEAYLDVTDMCRVALSQGVVPKDYRAAQEVSKGRSADESVASCISQRAVDCVMEIARKELGFDCFFEVSAAAAPATEATTEAQGITGKVKIPEGSSLDLGVQDQPAGPAAPSVRTAPGQTAPPADGTSGLAKGTGPAEPNSIPPPGPQAKQDRRGVHLGPALLGGHLQPALRANDAMLLAGAVIARRIRTRVEQRLGYTLSAGIAHNKPLAKIASDSRKPKKQTTVPAAAVPFLMRSLRVRDVPSLGGKVGQRVIEAAGGKEGVGEVLDVGEHQLRGRLGQESATAVLRALQGHGDAVVRPRTLTKQLMSAKSFQPVGSTGQCHRWVQVLANELAPRVLEDSIENERWPRVLAVMYRHASVKSQAMRSKQGHMVAIDIPPRKGAGARGHVDQGTSESDLCNSSSSSSSSSSKASTSVPPPPTPSDRLAAAAMALLRQVPTTDLLPCNRLAIVASSFVPRRAGTDLSSFFSSGGAAAASGGAGEGGVAKHAFKSRGKGGGILGGAKAAGGRKPSGPGAGIGAMLRSMGAEAGAHAETVGGTAGGGGKGGAMTGGKRPRPSTRDQSGGGRGMQAVGGGRSAKVPRSGGMAAFLAPGGATDRKRPSISEGDGLAGKPHDDSARSGALGTGPRRSRGTATGDGGEVIDLLAGSDSD